MASRNTMDMTTGPIFRKLLLFAYPLMINALVNSLYNVADKAIAGKYIGDAALAAVGTCTSPINLLVTTVACVAAGVSVLCGNYVGAKKPKELRECMHCAPVTGLLLGLLLCVTGLVCSRPLLIAMGTPETVLGDANTYLIVRMLGIPIDITNTFCLNILSSQGDTKRITIAGLLSGAINVVGNLFFVIVIPLGVAGVALSTVLSQALALSIKLVILFSPKDNYKLKFSQLRLYPNHLKEIFRIGIPAGINNLAFSLANVIMQSSVNSFGSIVMAGNSCADTIDALVTLFPNQMNAACSCAVSQCFGAKNFPRIRKSLQQSLLGTTIMTVSACTLVTVFAVPLLQLFTDDPAVVVAGIPKLLFISWGHVFYGFSVTYAGALRGIRQSGITMVMNILGICVPRLIWIWLVFPFFNTPTMLYLIYPISYLTSAILQGITYRVKMNALTAQHAPSLELSS